MNEPTFFCDYNAGGPADPDVLQCFLETERGCPGNPASAHAPGRRSRSVLEEARQRTAEALGVEPADVVFTSGGTEAANLAVHGLGDPRLPVWLSAAEHPAVIEPANVRGVQWMPVDATGAAIVLPPAAPVGLIALVHAQSELGTVQPVAAAAELAAALRVPLFVDAAQGLGRLDLGPVFAARAVVAVSPHKAGGLRGHGVLAGHDLQRVLRPWSRGGAQEHGLRPGTQSPSLALANALAIERAIAERSKRADAMRVVRDTFVNMLRDTSIEHRLLTPMANSVPNTVMLHFDRVDGRSLLPALDLVGVHASHGSACSTGAPTPPRVLTAIGLDDPRARACVRFSFAGNEAHASLQSASRRIANVVERLRKKNVAS